MGLKNLRVNSKFIHFISVIPTFPHFLEISKFSSKSGRKLSAAIRFCRSLESRIGKSLNPTFLRKIKNHLNPHCNFFFSFPYSPDFYISPRLILCTTNFHARQDGGARMTLPDIFRFSNGIS